MRRVVLMVVLALALPTAALANSILDYSNSTGTISASSSGLNLTSTITTISVVGGSILQTGNNLGTLSITTGALTGTNGNIETFGAGTLTITSSGGPVLFSGTFSSASFEKTPVSIGGMIEYKLDITLDGNRGGSFQTVFLSTSDFTGNGAIASGDTFVVVPEPGTMGLLGTGLVGIAGLVRRKLKV